MADQAPRSTRHVQYVLFKTDLPGEVVANLAILTEISHADRALTTVERPRVQRGLHDSWDETVRAALRSLPGASQSIVMTMGRTFTVEWNGICRPV